MFQITFEEAQACLGSRFQFGTLKRGKTIKYLPYVSTEHGAILAANVLNSPRAVRHWTLTMSREKLIKICANVVRHARLFIFQMAEVAIPRELFRTILERIAWLRLPMPLSGRCSLGGKCGKAKWLDCSVRGHKMLIEKRLESAV